MTKLIMDAPVVWKRGIDDRLFTYTPADNELVLDCRISDAVRMYVGDGEKQGGQLQEAALTKGIVTPVILTPVNDSTGINTQPLITSTGFLGLRAKGVADTHNNSEWELSTDPAFNNVIYRHAEDPNSLTELDLDALGFELESQTQYYVRVRYIGQSGNRSLFSNPVHFTTSSLFAGMHVGEIFSTSPVTSDRFGTAIAISADGNRMVISSPYYDTFEGADMGKVNLYERNPADGTWTDIGELRPDDASLNDHFGNALAMSGDGSVVFVGAYRPGFEGPPEARIYVFSLDTQGNFIELQQIDQDDVPGDFLFGSSLATNYTGTRLLVGGFDYSTNTLNQSGGAWLYERDINIEVWLFSKAITEPSLDNTDLFGSSVSMSSDGRVIYIGAKGKKYTDGTPCGAVYRYVEDGNGDWVNTNLYYPSVVQYEMGFGNAVSVTGDDTKLAISATSADGSLSGMGKVFTYDIMTGGDVTLTHTLTEPNPEEYGEFGLGLAYAWDKTTVYVGSRLSTVSGFAEAGKVCIYK